VTQTTHTRALAGIIGVMLSAVGMAAGGVVQNSAGQNRAAQNNAPGVDIIVPDASWPCGLPNGIPVPERGTLVFEAAMTLDRVADLGRTQYGRRQVAVVQGGALTGTRLTGSVMTGALDFQLLLANGVIEIEQIFVLRTGDGRYAYVRAAGTGPDAGDVRLVLDFEAPHASDVAWLNTGTYVGRRVLNPAARTMTLRVYDVSSLAPPSGPGRVVRIAKPAGALSQPWDYRKAAPSEKRGNQLIAETVTLSPSQAVGESKRGRRNIIPITGGELTGRLTGQVLPGGADYQHLTPPATIDARYLWQTADGEIIIVRNGGAFGSLVPTFEARVDGPSAWLNTGMFLSSNPEGRPGGVGLTFYESAR
jgi:hypothetical protein